MKRILGLENTKILTFFRANFDRVIPEERGSLELSFEIGELLYIIGFDGKGENIIWLLPSCMFLALKEATSTGLLSLTKLMIQQGLGSQPMVSHFATWV